MNINQIGNNNTIGGAFQNIPFGVKSVMVVTTIVFILSFFTPIPSLLVNYPIQIFHGLQLWRIFLTQFVEANIIGLAMSLWIFYDHGIRLEKKIGTAVFIVDFFIKNLLVQIVFLIMSLIIQNQLYPSYGLWNVCIVYITLECFANPEELRSLLFFPCLIPAKYLPFILVGIGLLLGSFFSPLAALLVGYLEARYFGSMIFRPTQTQIVSMENGFVFKHFKLRQDFYINQQNLHFGQQNQLPVSEPPQPWQGKGIQIGSGSNGDLNQFNFEQSENDLQQQSQQ